MAGLSKGNPASLTMLSPYVYHALLLGVCAYAFMAGRRDERYAAALS